MSKWMAGILYTAVLVLTAISVYEYAYIERLRWVINVLLHSGPN